ncbi:hypothetical protein RKD49_000196 [Streptomyces glaucescens]
MPTRSAQKGGEAGWAAVHGRTRPSKTSRAAIGGRRSAAPHRPSSAADVSFFCVGAFLLADGWLLDGVVPPPPGPGVTTTPVSVLGISYDFARYLIRRQLFDGRQGGPCVLRDKPAPMRSHRDDVR